MDKFIDANDPVNGMAAIIKSTVDNRPTLEDRVKQLAAELAPDYPNVGQCGVFDCLWAIEAACKGTTAANEDLHKLLKALQEKAGLNAEQVLALWEEVK